MSIGGIACAALVGCSSGERDSRQASDPAIRDAGVPRQNGDVVFGGEHDLIPSLMARFAAHEIPELRGKLRPLNQHAYVVDGKRVSPLPPDEELNGLSWGEGGRIYAYVDNALGRKPVNGVVFELKARCDKGAKVTRHAIDAAGAVAPGMEGVYSTTAPKAAVGDLVGCVNVIGLY